LDKDEIPLAAVFYIEEVERGLFTKYFFFEKSFQTSTIIECGVVKQSYLDAAWQINTCFAFKKPSTSKSAFFQKIEHLQEENTHSLQKDILKLLFDDRYSNTTYICQDQSGKNMVCININLDKKKKLL